MHRSLVLIVVAGGLAAAACSSDLCPSPLVARVIQQEATLTWQREGSAEIASVHAACVPGGKDNYRINATMEVKVDALDRGGWSDTEWVVFEALTEEGVVVASAYGRVSLRSGVRRTSGEMVLTTEAVKRVARVEGRWRD